MQTLFIRTERVEIAPSCTWITSLLKMTRCRFKMANFALDLNGRYKTDFWNVGYCGGKHSVSNDVLFNVITFFECWNIVRMRIYTIHFPTGYLGYIYLSRYDMPIRIGCYSIRPILNTKGPFYFVFTIIVCSNYCVVCTSANHISWKKKQGEIIR